MSRLWLLVILVCAAASLSATPLFVAGDLLWGTWQDGRIYKISTGTAAQNFSSVQPIATLGAQQYGQMAFSLDAKTAYITVYGSDKVVALTDQGVVSDFVTGISNPTGIIRTSTGKLLVASFDEGNIYDISGGTAVLYASGLVNPRNMAETASGNVYVADQGSMMVKQVTQGNLAAVAPLAFGLAAKSIASFNNKLYITTDADNYVYEVTSGNMTNAPKFAVGKNFISLAVANGKLYAGTGSSTASTSGIWEIPKGSYTTANSLAYNMANAGDSLLSVVPVGVEPPPPPPPPPPPATIPEPGTAMAGLALLTIGFAWERRRRS